MKQEWQKGSLRTAFLRSWWGSALSLSLATFPWKTNFIPTQKGSLCPHTQLWYIGLTASFYSRPRRNDKMSCLSVLHQERCSSHHTSSHISHFSLTFVKNAITMADDPGLSETCQIQFPSTSEFCQWRGVCYTSTCLLLCSDCLTRDLEMYFKGWTFAFFSFVWLQHSVLQGLCMQ